jgi:hypothetical protein
VFGAALALFGRRYGFGGVVPGSAPVGEQIGPHRNQQEDVTQQHDGAECADKGEEEDVDKHRNVSPTWLCLIAGVGGTARMWREPVASSSNRIRTQNSVEIATAIRLRRWYRDNIAPTVRTLPREWANSGAPKFFGAVSGYQPDALRTR